ncbi:hypothetical protein KCP74_15040 [Salmonella enterica subsp. enterica]|nr:hypothetical protein KCP74_15040 [Salmonella enterica subsp. enterica]
MSSRFTSTGSDKDFTRHAAVMEQHDETFISPAVSADECQQAIRPSCRDDDLSLGSTPSVHL